MRSTGEKRRPVRRHGKTLVFFALTLPLLLGMIGLVLDGGLLMAAHRQVQNVADTAATAAAMDKFRGATDAAATATANTFMANNGMSSLTLTLNGGATNAINIPPQDPGNSGSPYKGVVNYVEAVVSYPVTTMFVQIIGVNRNQQVTARAVAGFEPVGAGEGVFVLDDTVSPGLQINNSNSRLIVNGDITVNSAGGGVDQFGATVASVLNADAVKVSNATVTPAPIVATALNVVGGVTDVDNIRAYDAAFGPTNYYDASNTDRPVFARAPIAPDPLLSLATPTTTSPGSPYAQVQPFYPDKTGANQGSPQSIILVNNDTVTLVPGIYKDISIGNGANVTFSQGIYVLASGSTNTMKITGGTVQSSGNGVMFYNTGSNYNPTSGAPDNSDGSTTPATINGIGGAFQITGGTVSLLPLTDAGSPFNGLLFYQRRFNTNTATVSGSGNLNLQGTLYAKWAQFHLSGQGSYQAQFIVGSMAIDGGATVTINAAGKNLGKANLVFLVE